jgi:hypothetical protein
MKPPVRAALINAFLFPGVGHIHLKRVARGCIFLVPTLLAAIVFLSGAVDQANQIAEQILSAAIPLDPSAIAAQLERSSANTPSMTISVYVLIGCWAASIADALLMLKDER